MIIWFALLIPVLAAVVLLILYRRQMVWWEFTIPFGISLFLIAMFKLTTSAAQTTDTEYWGGYVTKVQYYEDWNEWITMICYREVECGTDSDGNTIYCTESYDCSYEEYHPAEWHALESNGFTLNISRQEYERLVQQFAARPYFVDMHRSYYTDDGDMYEAAWNGDQQTFEPVTTVHLYENRVQAARSVFNFAEVNDSTKAQYHLYDYPSVNNPFAVPGILGPNLPGKQVAERQLAFLNATLGAPKKVRLWVLLFQNQPIEAGYAQEALWKRGNKNEFILTIGVNGQSGVDWVYPISWTEVERLKVDARYFVDTMRVLNLPAITDWLAKEIPAQWEKKDFHKFDYLTIEPPAWAVAVTFFVTFLVNCVISFWLVSNEFTEAGPKGY